MKNFYKLSFVLLLIFLTSGLNCNTTEPPVNGGALTLSLADVSSTEAWVELKAQNVSFPAQINFLLDSKALMNISLTSADTTIYIDSLQPNKTYNLQAFIQSSILSQAASNKLTVTTLDTTSNNFTFTTYTFGDAGAGSSYLSDVAIINENDIWAVGEIYMNDSTGKPDPQPYNAVRWDGSKWELKRITTEFRGNLITVPLEGIFAFSSTDIWMVGSLPIHGDGKTWTMYDVRTTTDPNLSLSKGWGSNSNDMYFVGRGGSIAHYSNGQWSKIESGTSLDIQDILGDFNKGTDKYEILAVASNVYSSFDRVILSIDPVTNKLTQLSSFPIGGTLSSVWFKSKIKYYVTGGGGNFEKHSLSDKKWQNSSIGISRYSIIKIRGNGLNNVFGAGGAGEVIHFNGITTKSYFNTTKLANGNYYSIAIKDNLVVAAGQDNPAAVLIIGRR